MGAILLWQSAMYDRGARIKFSSSATGYVDYFAPLLSSLLSSDLTFVETFMFGSRELVFGPPQRAALLWHRQPKKG